jgi:hypothetical protein
MFMVMDFPRAKARVPERRDEPISSNIPQRTMFWTIKFSNEREWSERLPGYLIKQPHNFFYAEITHTSPDS